MTTSDPSTSPEDAMAPFGGEETRQFATQRTVVPRVAMKMDVSPAEALDTMANQLIVIGKQAKRDVPHSYESHPFELPKVRDVPTQAAG